MPYILYYEYIKTTAVAGSANSQQPAQVIFPPTQRLMPHRQGYYTLFCAFCNSRYYTIIGMLMKSICKLFGGGLKRKTPLFIMVLEQRVGEMPARCFATIL